MLREAKVEAMGPILLDNFRLSFICGRPDNSTIELSGLGD